MKKPVTLLMLTLLLLNVLGYYGVFVGLQVQRGKQARQALDMDHFSQGEAMTFRIPVSVPYAMDSKEYERVDGDFEYHGEVYRLVKQKLDHDTLYIVCWKDGRSSTINQALADYVKTFTDKPASGKQEVKLFQNFSKDYISETIQLQSAQSGWVRSTDAVGDEFMLPPAMSFSIDLPPRL